MEDTQQDVTAPKPIKNIDAQLVAAMQDIQDAKEPDNVSRETKEDAEPEAEKKEPEVESETKEDVKEAAPITSDKSIKDEKPESKAEKAETDEYGEPIAKEKVYTEAEVQKMIRERLSRGRHAEQQATQQVQQAAKDFTPDTNSDDSWEVQLEQFIDKTLEKKQTQAQQKQWQQAEIQRQSEFEEKFTSGMGKYKDFHDVVAGKPITDSIMLATRSLDNPAAFIYAAAKTQAKELERIANLGDPIQQAAEIGRLDEKMRKARTATAAAKPIKGMRSDVSDVKPVKRSIDDKILSHAKSKFRR